MSLFNNRLIFIVGLINIIGGIAFYLISDSNVWRLLFNLFLGFYLVASGLEEEEE